MMGSLGWGMGLAGGVWMIGGLILFAGLVALFVRALVGPTNRESGGARAPQPTALEILRERFARGEITDTEFDQAKTTLGHA